MTDWLIEKLCCWPAEDRRRFAMRALVWSAVLGVVNIALWLVGLIPDRVMLAITLLLSWLALTVTFGDIVIGTDVRVEVEVEES